MDGRPFNKGRKNRPMEVLRQIVPGLRRHDVDVPDEDIALLADSLAAGAVVKEAVHGRGDGWTEVGPGYDPYARSPLTTFVPQFGGRWRRDFPGSGDQHINDDSDKQKNLKGNAPHEDFDPVLQRQKINDAIDQLRKKTTDQIYVILLELDDEEQATEELAQEVFGEDGICDGTNVVKITVGFEEALGEQRRQRAKGRNVRIETE